MRQRILAEVAIARWAVRITWMRASNRLWDAAGRAAGYCMADTWQPTRAAYGRGMKHLRCGRRKHGRVWHRSGDYRWCTGNEVIYDRAPTDVGEGILPGWLRGVHYPVGTRRRDALTLRVAFERLQARAQRSAAR